MVGMGLLGGVSIVTMKVMQDQAGNEAYLKQTAAVNRATLQVQNVVGNAARCNQMLVGKTREGAVYPNINFTTATTLPGGRLEITQDGRTQILLDDDLPYADGFYIPPNGIRLTRSALGDTVSEIVIRFHIRNRVGSKNTASLRDNTNPNVIIKRIPFMVEMAGDTIRSCGPIISDADVAAKKTMCDSLGSAASWNGTSCDLSPMVCPNPGEIPIEVASLGRVNCMPATQANMNEIFDFSSSSCAPGQSVTLAPSAMTSGSGTKIRAVCTGTPTGCPGGVTLTWKVGDHDCVASSPTSSASFNSSSVSFSDPDSGVPGDTSGSATFQCSDGRKAWVIVGTPTCISSAKNCLAGTTVRWSGATKFCSATTTALISHKQSSTISDSTNSGGSDGTGSTAIECNNGILSVISTAANPTVCN